MKADRLVCAIQKKAAGFAPGGLRFLQRC